MGGEDDRRAVEAELADQFPHVAAQLDVDAGGRLVEEQDVGLVAERLGDHHPALHAAGQFHHLGLALVPQRQALEQDLDLGRVARLAEQAAAEADRRPDAFERVGGQFLRHQADAGAGVAVVGQLVLAVDQHRRRPTAVTMPQTMLIKRRLAGAVGAEQRENLAAADVEVDRSSAPRCRWRRTCAGRGSRGSRRHSASFDRCRLGGGFGLVLGQAMAHQHRHVERRRTGR